MVAIRLATQHPQVGGRIVARRASGGSTEDLFDQRLITDAQLPSLGPQALQDSRRNPTGFYNPAKMAGFWRVSEEGAEEGFQGVRISRQFVVIFVAIIIVPPHTLCRYSSITIYALVFSWGQPMSCLSPFFSSATE